MDGLFWELLQMAITCLGIGYIFMDFFKKPSTEMYYYSRAGRREFLLATIAAIPSIVFHELGHKFTAIFFGGIASYHLHPFLFLGVLLKAIGFPFIFIVPAYVNISGLVSWQYTLIALAGPLVNLAVWGISKLVTRYEWAKGEKYLFFLVLGRINKWLFIFNMLPFPGTDGYKVLMGLFV